ncbi:MAG: DUF6968 family protein [Vicinamibacterales bacterium]
MTPVSMSTEVASRTFRFRCSDGTEKTVVVRIGVPIADSGGPRDNWACPYEITAFDRVRTSAMLGIDSVQALTLTLHILPTELRALARDHGGAFLDAEDLELEGVCRSTLERASEQGLRRRLAPETFRKRLLIEGYFARRELDAGGIRDYFTAITARLGLRTYGEPIVHQTSGQGKAANEGYDAFVPLIDSGIYVCV